MAYAQEMDVANCPLEDIDVSRPELFKKDTWQPWFARLRKEAPIHYIADSVNGPFWSVCSHALIKEVDSNNAVFSSEKGGIAIVDPYTAEEGQMQGQSFIQLDEPKHMKQGRQLLRRLRPKTSLSSNRLFVRES